ncbi:Tetrahydrocannabinolic acid synthase [Dendrobium catenatum]|uniref:Tetrahydrocannabinolic acid synthase n=1 Tax=Dendrobium catenatum TaxID=906689 RepID=A0A2I0VPD3_9ASPA|nr:Tetrahydrocannabinolic acid synthase [Dendrobium catenatum]
MNYLISFFLSLLLSLLLLFLFPSHDNNNSHAAIKAKQQAFLHCLQSHFIPSNLIFTSETQNYTTLFISSIQNPRILTPNSYKPLLIITPTQEFHVQSTVSCSQELNIPPKIRSGGHDYEGLSSASTITPFFIVIDLRKLSSISIDQASDSAWVEAGATIGELYYAIAKKSKVSAFPAGSYSTVGVGGHFSGGGVGTLVRAYGLAIDNIIDARIVTSKGDILDRESMGEDLFWAIRGGGGASFGVILSYKIQLVQVPPKVTVFTTTRIKLLTKWQQIAHKLDNRAFIQVNLLVVDEVIIDKTNMKTKKTIEVIFNSLFLGEKQELLSIAEEFFPELELKAEDCREMSWIESVLHFADFSTEVDPTVLLDRSFKAKSDFLTEPIKEEAWEKIFSWLVEEEERPMLKISPFGGRMDEISETETPFPHRKGTLYDLLCLLAWKEEGKEEEAKRYMKWMKKYYEFMSPYVSGEPRGAYINGRDLQLGINGEGNTSYVKASEWGLRYFKGNFRRLAQVKTKVDPGNLFRDEQSIPVLV